MPSVYRYPAPWGPFRNQGEGVQGLEAEGVLICFASERKTLSKKASKTIMHYYADGG